MRILIVTFISFLSLKATAQINREKNIQYANNSAVNNRLDVYFPADVSVKKGVFVFIHGGSWKNGKKETYKFLGKNMAARGFVTAIINYRLYPEATYTTIAHDCANAIKWAVENISAYGGDPDQITVAGHSAGGHLAAYIALNNSYESDLKNPIARVILIDAFGLDMATYFKEYNNDYSKSLLPVFGIDAEQWKQASPIYAIRPEVKIPFLVLTGSKTFPAILSSNKAFAIKLRENNITCEDHIVNGKKHIGMISQFYFKRNKAYGLLTQFMNSPVRERNVNALK